MFKVVGIDNLNRDNVSDTHINIPRFRKAEDAQAVVELLNAQLGSDASTYYVVYPADKPLYKWEP